MRARSITAWALGAAACAGCGPPPATSPLAALHLRRPVFVGCHALHRDAETIDVACPTFHLSIRRAPAGIGADSIEAVMRTNLVGSPATVAPYSLTIEGRPFSGTRYAAVEPDRRGFVVLGPADGGEQVFMACFNDADQPADGIATRCSAAFEVAIARGLPRSLFAAAEDG